MFKKLLLPLLFLGNCSLVMSQSDNWQTKLNPHYITPSSAGLYDMVEVAMEDVFGVTDTENPDIIDIEGIFESPTSTSYKMPGFLFQDYQEKQNRVVTKGNREWRIRFAPNETGIWKASVEVHFNGSTKKYALGNIQVNPSANRGFLKIAANNRRVFETSNGQALMPIGLNVFAFDNLKVIPGEKIAAGRVSLINGYVNKMAAAGANFGRVLNHTMYSSLDNVKNPVSGYNGSGYMHPQMGWEFDQIYKNAQEKGVYLLMCMDNAHSTINLTYAKDNQKLYDKFLPYAHYLKENGGCIETSKEFFINEEAKKLFKQKLRYCIARYGAYQSFAVTELLNELRHIEPDPKQAASWNTEMAAYIKVLDPYKRPVSNSYYQAATKWKPYVTSNAGLDIYDVHSYAFKNIAEGFKATITFLDSVSKVQKPVLYTEFGTNEKLRGKGGDRKLDPTGIYIHNGIWALGHTGAAGGLPWFTWSHIDPLNLYSVFTPYSRFVSDWVINKNEWKPRMANLTDDTYQAYVMQHETNFRVWIKNKNNTYLSPTSVVKKYPDALLLLSVPKDGLYEVKWFDTYRGKYYKTETVKSDKKILSIPFTGTGTDFAMSIQLK